LVKAEKRSEKSYILIGGTPSSAVVGVISYRGYVSSVFGVPLCITSSRLWGRQGGIKIQVLILILRGTSMNRGMMERYMKTHWLLRGTSMNRGTGIKTHWYELRGTGMMEIEDPPRGTGMETQVLVLVTTYWYYW